LQGKVDGESHLIGLGWIHGAANLPKIDDCTGYPLHNEGGTQVPKM
jgi:hypothetical protein